MDVGGGGDTETTETAEPPPVPFGQEEEIPEPSFIPHRVFINNVDTFNTSTIASILANKFYGPQEEMGEGDEEMVEGEELPADDSKSQLVEKVKYQIIGTVKNPQSYKQSEDVYQIIQEGDEHFIEEILKCGVIIYDISSDPGEIKKALATLKMIDKYIEERIEEAPKKFEAADENRMFILISTVMTWALTKPIDPEEPHVPFTEADYKRRRPHPNYKEHCVLEKEAMTMGKKLKGKLFVTVIASGITYGKQENDLHLLFQQAWNNSGALPLIGNPKNRVPLIHVTDLASTISGCVDQQSEKPLYILAVEQTPCTQKKIVKGISKTLGSGKMKLLTKDEGLQWPDMNQELFDKLTVNLRMEPNYIVNDLAINFQSELNFAENIGKVVQEYKDTRNLLPKKILMHGPPAVGKTSIAKILAEKYGLQYINVATLIQNTIAKMTKDIEIAKRKLKEKEEKGEEAVEEEEEEEEAVAEEEDENERINEMMNKLKKICTARDVKPNDYYRWITDVEDIEDRDYGRLPDELIIEMMKKKLSSLPCQNQGYILDGYPKTEEQAKLLFFGGGDDDEGEEAEPEEDEEGGGGKKSQIIPDYVISLEADDEFLCKRVMQKPESEIQGTHYTEERMLQRLSNYRRNNTEDNTLLNLFDYAEIHPIVIKADTDDQERIVNIILEKLGEKKGYPPSEKEIEHHKQEELKKQQAEERLEKEKKTKIEEELEAERQANMEKWLELNRKQQEAEERMLQEESRPIREYIIKYVFPTLSKGLVEVARIKPDDPMDYLAEYLLRENPEGHMFDPAYVEEADTLINTIREYQHQISKFLDIGIFK